MFKFVILIFYFLFVNKFGNCQPPAVYNIYVNSQHPDNTVSNRTYPYQNNSQSYFPTSNFNNSYYPGQGYSNYNNNYRPNNSPSFKPGTVGWNVYPSNNITYHQTSKNHSLILGTSNKYYDHLGYNKVHNKGKAWFSSKTTKEFEYHTPGNKMIKAIQIIDLLPNGLGGYAYVTNGGVGQKKVTVLLKSQENKGFAFHVYIWIS